MRTIAAGEFKAKCLSVIQEVKETGEPVLITKRGKPVVRVVAISATPHSEPEDSLFSFLRGMLTVPEGVDLVTSEHADNEWERIGDEKWNRLESEKPE